MLSSGYFFCRHSHSVLLFAASIEMDIGKDARKCIRWENLAKTERTDGTCKRQSPPIDRPNFEVIDRKLRLTSPGNGPTEIHERIFQSSFRHGISRLSFLLFLFANSTTCSGTTKRRRRQSLNVWHGRSLVTSVLVSCSLSSSLDYAFCSHRVSIKIKLVLRSTSQFARLFRVSFRRSQVLMRSLEGNWLKCH